MTVKSLTHPWRLWHALLLVGVLTTYLLVRYTQLLPWLGIWMPPAITGIVPGWAGIVLVGLFSWAGLTLLRRKKVLANRTVLGASGLILAGSLVLGTFSYTPFNDEERDHAVVQSLSQYGVAQYWGIPDEMPEAEANRIRFQQRLHPPLNSLLGGLFLGPMVALQHLRLFWLLIAGLGALLLIRLGRASPGTSALLLGGILLLSFPHFRNYMIIRAGNDLLGFVGMSAWVLIQIPIIRNKQPWSWKSGLLMVLFLGLAIWSKFSSLVAVSAWLAALGVMAIRHKECRGIWLAGIAALIMVLAAYGICWAGTPMLQGQLAHYGKYALRLGIELPFAEMAPPPLMRPAKTLIINPMPWKRSLPTNTVHLSGTPRPD